MTLNQTQNNSLSSFASLVEGWLFEKRLCVHILQTDPETGGTLVKVEFDNNMMTKPLWVGRKGSLKTETGKRILNNGGKLAKRVGQTKREELFA